jgi:uncharacterized protein
MTTNGTLLTREVFLRLRSWGIRPMVSMDGTKKLHDSQRPFKNGAPSWDTITDNLAKIGPEVRELAVRATVPDADTDLVDCLVTLQKLGFSEIRLSGLCPNSGMPVNQQDFEFETWKRRYLQLMDYVLATAQGPEEIPEGGMRADVLSLKNRRRTYFCCGTGRYYYYVDPAGDLYPCFRLMTEDRRERLGKLGEPIDPLKASAFLETNVLTTQCRSCWARYLCGGPCFGDAFFSFGDYATPHALTCQQKKFRLQCAAYVLDKLSEKEHTS